VHGKADDNAHQTKWDSNHKEYWGFAGRGALLRCSDFLRGIRIRSILITMLLLLSGAAQALVVDFEEYVGLGVFQPVTTIESQGFLFTEYAGSYMMVGSWTWGSIPLLRQPPTERGYR
jgi:hypothetical protein